MLRVGAKGGGGVNGRKKQREGKMEKQWGKRGAVLEGSGCEESVESAAVSSVLQWCERDRVVGNIAKHRRKWCPSKHVTAVPLFPSKTQSCHVQGSPFLHQPPWGPLQTAAKTCCEEKNDDDVNGWVSRRCLLAHKVANLRAMSTEFPRTIKIWNTDVQESSPLCHCAR